MGAHFEALDECVLVAALDIFSHFNFPESAVNCEHQWKTQPIEFGNFRKNILTGKYDVYVQKF